MTDEFTLTLAAKTVKMSSDAAEKIMSLEVEIRGSDEHITSLENATMTLAGRVASLEQEITSVKKKATSLEADRDRKESQIQTCSKRAHDYKDMWADSDDDLQRALHELARYKGDPVVARLVSDLNTAGRERQARARGL